MAGLIVHEWIAKAGGSERVVDEMVATFPDADLQVLWSDVADRYPAQTFETWLARTPLRHSKAIALPLMPATWRNLRGRSSYDWMLVSSHLFAHHARVRGAAIPKLVYAHTPARYIWSPELDQRGDNWAVRAASSVLKPIDRHRAQEPVAIAANSEFTRARIQRAWGRESEVIYPPVDTERITAVGSWEAQLSEASAELLWRLPSTFVLGASRFVPYKRLELVIEAGEALDLPVVLAGSGPDHNRLLDRANSAAVPVHFVDRPDDDLLYALFQRASAYIFPAIEDFGIMPVEAMACGTPVIVPNRGGAGESVSLVEGGAILREETPDGWREAFSEATRIDRAALRLRVNLLSSTRFRARIRAWLNASVQR